jgi:hypothetical protein
MYIVDGLEKVSATPNNVAWKHGSMFGFGLQSASTLHLPFSTAAEPLGDTFDSAGDCFDASRLSAHRSALPGSVEGAPVPKRQQAH